MKKGNNTILVVDTDLQTSKVLELELDSEFFSVHASATGKDAVRLSISLKPDLILLDLDLPDMEGNDVITALRAWSHVPIIVLSARSSSEDAVVALDLGADDYMTKPFDMSVLKAHINAHLRNASGRDAGEPELLNGILKMDLAEHKVYIEGQLVPFTRTEYDLLRFFMTHCGKMLTHEEILLEVWGSAQGTDHRHLRAFISKIREKIHAISPMSSLITTESGVGYRMEMMAPSPAAPGVGNEQAA